LEVDDYGWCSGNGLADIVGYDKDNRQNGRKLKFKEKQFRMGYEEN